jgi:hypothetical protein
MATFCIGTSGNPSAADMSTPITGWGQGSVPEQRCIYSSLSQMVQLQATKTIAHLSSLFQLSFTTELFQNPHTEIR